MQRSEGYAEYRQRRVVVEHRLARLVQLGMRQGRYFGCARTLFQLLMAAAVANLTLVAGKVGMMGEDRVGNYSRTFAFSFAVTSVIWRDDTHARHRESLTVTSCASPPYSLLVSCYWVRKNDRIRGAGVW